MKHIKTFESFLNESEGKKTWKVAYAGKGFYGVTNGGDIEGEMSKEEAEKEAAKRNSTNESLTLNEADMTKFYDGFIIQNAETDEIFKFRYRKGIKNTIVEEDAIKILMNATGLPRGYFGVSGFVKKGTWDNDITPIFNK